MQATRPNTNNRMEGDQNTEDRGGCERTSRVSRTASDSSIRFRLVGAEPFRGGDGRRPTHIGIRRDDDDADRALEHALRADSTPSAVDAPTRSVHGRAASIVMRDAICVCSSAAMFSSSRPRIVTRSDSGVTAIASCIRLASVVLVSPTHSLTSRRRRQTDSRRSFPRMLN